MDIYNLEKHLELASFSGSTLSTEERYYSINSELE